MFFAGHRSNRVHRRRLGSADHTVVLTLWLAQNFNQLEQTREPIFPYVSLQIAALLLVHCGSKKETLPHSQGVLSLCHSTVAGNSENFQRIVKRKGAIVYSKKHFMRFSSAVKLCVCFPGPMLNRFRCEILKPSVQLRNCVLWAM